MKDFKKKDRVKNSLGMPGTVVRTEQTVWVQMDHVHPGSPPVKYLECHLEHIEESEESNG